MRKYVVLISRSAGKSLGKIPLKIVRTIQEKIEALASDPYPYYSQQLVGFKGLFKIRVGEYRIIYTVKNDQLEVLIIDIEHRTKVYRKL